VALFGNPVPRLFTEPARELTRRTTRGFECAEFARHVIGEPLLPWQEWVVNHALELNPDGSYRYRIVLILVARQNGKTHLLKTITLWRMFMDGARLVVGAAQDLTTAREVWQSAVDTTKASAELAAEVLSVRYANGEQTLTLNSGARYIIKAATRGAGRGLSVDQLNLDEVREWRGWEPWSALSKTTQARANGQIWTFSNAGDDESVVLNRLRESALNGADPSIFIAEWSAPDGCDLDDETAWCQANPGLGHTVSEQAIRTALATDPPAVFRTEVLCQHVSQLDEAVPMAAWLDCADPAGTMESLRARVVVGIDVAPDGQHVSAVAAATASNGYVRVEVLGAWKDTTTARSELPELLQRVNPRAIAWFPGGPAAALGPVLRAERSVELKGSAVAEACQSFADLVLARRIVHSGDPLLTSQVNQATRLAVGDGWRFARRGGAGHVDACYAAAGAVTAALSLPTVGKPRLIVAA
jgi:phage terminase large subunit-like protein